MKPSNSLKESNLVQTDSKKILFLLVSTCIRTWVFGGAPGGLITWDVMRVYVFRHGIAEDAAPGQDDSTRRLTPKGIEKLNRILRTAREAGVRPDMILTSPYVRAVQTAEAAKEALGFEGELIETEVLVPYQNPFDLWREILSHGTSGELMVVGHNPLLSDFVCFLTGTPSYGIVLKKGAIAMVDVLPSSPRPQGSLIWLLTARIAGGGGRTADRCDGRTAG